MDRRLAEAYTVPSEKIRALIQFNKITGEPVAEMMWVDPETLNNDFFVYREVMFDFQNDMVVGTADNFEIKNKLEMPIVMTEEQLDAAARDKITKEYPVIQQVNIVGTAILKLEEQLRDLTAALKERFGMEFDLSSATAQLVEMRNYIDEVKRANTIRKTFYQESPDYEYISYEAAAAAEARRLEGGLHEAYGPRPTTGGSVF
jgi:hypothetical protein